MPASDPGHHGEGDPASAVAPFEGVLVSGPEAGAAGGYNTARAGFYFTPVPNHVIERVAKPLRDGYDLRVLPSHALYQVATGGEAVWFPEFVHEYRNSDGHAVQVLGFAGHPPGSGDPDARAFAEAGFAECMESLGGVDTSDLARWQSANIDDQRDPGLQDRSLVFDGPSTWDAARRAKLWQLWDEVYARVGEPFGPGGPAFEEFWGRVAPLLPPVEAAGPGRVVHFDGKPGNVVLAYDIPTVIDWDSVAVTFTAPEHAAVIDLVRYLHLDGRNPLTTAPERWLPTARRWSHAVPDARRPVEQATRFYGPVGQEALYDLTCSAACDILRGCDGSVPSEYAVDAVSPLLPLLGFPRVPAEVLRARYADLHGQAPGNPLVGAEPVHGPPHRTQYVAGDRQASTAPAAGSHPDLPRLDTSLDGGRRFSTPSSVQARLTHDHVQRQIPLMAGIASALDDVRRLQEDAGQEPSRDLRDVVESLTGARPNVLTGGLMSELRQLTFNLSLGMRTATIVRDAVVTGQASADDPSGWVDLPRMPEHTRRLITHVFPRKSADIATAPHSSGQHSTRTPSAGLTPMRQLAHRTLGEQGEMTCFSSTEASARGVRSRVGSSLKMELRREP
ncbi:histidine phosphatase family protein [Yinghuangia sp. ASG 101]|uniref:histidine phosphatase family protein n=1 Tax=Yinghuangia sp. ASG 101 TaxID=2896848 RepID=UPI001E469E05|nr:histidine phosphatase family protein [Yinghuangia sp. ASG 101]UGQ11370.1 histidine phosphatase family protein [Yinghuangia sp. ASG 101]